MLLVFNRTASPITLAGLSVVVPPSTSAPERGPALDITSELRGRSGGEYAALEAQRAAGTLDYLWTSYVEYDVATLSVEVQGKAPGFATQATWYIDPVGGDDANTGLTALSPIKTFTERRRRINGQPINQVTTHYVQDNVPDTDPMVIEDELGPLGQLLFVGNKPLTTLHTSLTGFTTVVATNPATNQQVQVSDTALSDDWGALGLLNVLDEGNELQAFTRIRITSGARAGAIAYPVRDITPGSRTARCSQFTRPNTTFTQTATGLRLVTPVNGDPYVVETGLTTIASLVCRIKVSATQDTIAFTSNPRVMFYNFDLRDAPNNCHVVELRGPALANVSPTMGHVQFSACDVRSFTHPVTGTTVVYDHCKIGSLSGVFVPFGGPIVTIAGLVVGQLQTWGYAHLTYRTLFELGGNLSVQSGLCKMSDIGFFNSPAAIGVLPGGIVRAEGIGGSTVAYGSGNGTAVSLQAGAKFHWTSQKPTLTGTDECTISSNGSFPWTSFGDSLVCLTTGAQFSKR